MFNKKDYRAYFKQLYDVEINMKHEAKALLKIIKNAEAQKLLKHIITDEIRHAKLVKEMSNLI